MENLFQGSALFVFFFSMIAVFNYSKLSLVQKFSIIYITIYALVFTGVIGLKWALVYLALTMICYLELLTEDSMKLKLLTNPVYKAVDCIYLSFAQYHLFFVLLSLFCLYYRVLAVLGDYSWAARVISFLLLTLGIIFMLRQKYVLNTFQKMYHVFSEFPANKVEFNDRLKEAGDILIAIEDREYYSRKAYSIASWAFVSDILKNKFLHLSFKEKVRKCGQVISETFSLKRGYSTIPMQLISSLGVKYGYSCKIRRKIYEILYSRMFFEGMKRMMEDEKVGNRDKFKEYLVYIYFHSVNTFLCGVRFAKFLNAFDMTGSGKNNKDIYDCSNEGIFIACMGLSKRARRIGEDTVDYYLSPIPVELDREKILKMRAEMMNKPYDGNYLK